MIMSSDFDDSSCFPHLSNSWLGSFVDSPEQGCSA